MSQRFVSSIGVWLMVVACGPSVTDPSPASGGGSSTGQPASTGPVPPGTTTGGSTTAAGTTTVDTTTSDAVDTGSSSDGGFVFMRDLLGGPNGSCIPARDDCPRGQKCVPESSVDDIFQTTQCVSVPGDAVGVGEACTVMGVPTSGFDDCEAGAFCWDIVPGTLEGTCVPFCHDRLAPCGAGDVCMSSSLFTPFVCMALCDPLGPVTCGPDQTCRGVAEEFICMPDGIVPDGLSCGADDVFCAPSEYCAFSDALAGCNETRCCTSLCDLSAPDPDAPCALLDPGYVCRIPVEGSDPPVGLEHVGICGLPV